MTVEPARLHRFYIGAQGGTRTHKTQALDLVHIPILLQGQWSAAKLTLMSTLVVLPNVEASYTSHDIINRMRVRYVFCH